MPKQKVAFIIESWVTGGAEKVLIEYVNHLDASRYDITVYSVFRHSVYQTYRYRIDKPFKPHIHYKPLVNNRYGWLYKLFNATLNRHPKLLFRLLFKKHDTYIAFYEGLPTTWLAQAATRQRKIAWLHTSTALSQSKTSHEQLETQSRLYQMFDNIVAVSGDVRDSFIKTFPHVNPNKICVINNPINIESIRDMGRKDPKIHRPTDRKLLVSVGRITPAKGYERYLEVLSTLADKGVKPTVWIVGGGDAQALKSYCETHHLHHVHFWGNQDNPYPIMVHADWVVIPSLIEGLSTVALEALALGKAVLATDCPGMKEIFGDNDYGLVIDNDSESLARGIETICADDGLRDRYQKTATHQADAFAIPRPISLLSELLC